MTSGRIARSSLRSVVSAYGVGARFDTAPLDSTPIVRPSGTSQSGVSRGSGRAPACSRAERRSAGS